MDRRLKATRVAVLSIWIGAIFFFAIAVAPSVFAVLTPHEGGRALAGDIVGQALAMLHDMGLICGALFIILSRCKFNSVAIWLVFCMMLLTATSEFAITPRIHVIRTSTDFASLAPSDPQRATFDRLHKASTATEGAVLLLGIVALIAEARRRADG